MTDNNSQASALADAILPLIMQNLKKELPGLVDENLAGLKANTEKLLDQLKDKNRDDLLKAADAQVQARLDKGLVDLDAATKPLRITRADARDRTKYLAAQKLAVEKGVKLEIVNE